MPTITTNKLSVSIVEKNFKVRAVEDLPTLIIPGPKDQIALRIKPLEEGTRIPLGEQPPHSKMLYNHLKFILGEKALPGFPKFSEHMLRYYRALHGSARYAGTVGSVKCRTFCTIDLTPSSRLHAKRGKGIYELRLNSHEAGGYWQCGNESGLFKITTGELPFSVNQLEDMGTKGFTDELAEHFAVRFPFLQPASFKFLTTEEALAMVDVVRAHYERLHQERLAREAV